MSGVNVGYLVAGFALQTVQTTLTGVAWYFILRAGFAVAPPYRQVLAAYAAGVALNGFLPANIGTFVMLLMFVAMIPGADFAGVLGAAVVQRISLRSRACWSTSTFSSPCRARSSSSSASCTITPC